MRKFFILCGVFCVVFMAYAEAFSQKGFSIELGLLYDKPQGSSNSRPYAGMEPGFGYTANLAYDFFDWGGLELGVMHTSHTYRLAVIGGSVNEDDADKTTFFIRARVCPYKRGKIEVITSGGFGLFDIEGKHYIQPNLIDDDFSGPGYLVNFSLRYHITEGLTLAGFFGANFVDYNRYEMFGYKADYSGDMPSGDSICWGITIFHRIGIPQL